MFCLQCGYSLHGTDNRCPECGHPFNAQDSATFARRRLSTLWPRTCTQRLCTVLCGIPPLLNLVFLFEEGRGGSWLRDSLAYGALGSAGPLGLVITYFIEPVLNPTVFLGLLALAALLQWGVLWAMAMRSLSPRRHPSPSTLVLVLFMFLALSAVAVNLHGVPGRVQKVEDRLEVLESRENHFQRSVQAYDEMRQVLLRVLERLDRDP